ncbi:MAG: hypothetical protein HOM52_18640 [Rhodospirillaceae bacterium]|jgi:hypothetical protein|nr:hypothetical protein [Rhodospirillaceae bacterium]MBT4425981.1 hypothetical protein [Rhodospirillaceae bacterium]MBT5040529.1 hypothetical protein [Rhodospirillaceae bacterium]MBT5677145.1 hypothetical protein [Rhodospirillaceae bacterium]MBT5780281.1 hypothetical protein [Rhodospirillaceae bacterium]
MKSANTNKGTIIRLMGVVLIILGALDGMLSWRAGVPLSSIYVFLILGGALLYIVGVLRHGEAPKASELHED